MTIFIVNSLADTIADDGELTLREAVLAANEDPDLETDPDTIIFASHLAGGTIRLSGTEIGISGEHLTIVGLGADQLTIDAMGNSRIFTVSGYVTAEVSGLTLTGGSDVTGGAIQLQGPTLGSLTLRDVVIANNFAAVAGAIDSNGRLNIINSEIRDNRAVQRTGGIVSNSILTIVDSTIRDNSVDFSGTGGGLDLDGWATISGSTFSGHEEGAITNFANLTITDSTFYDNFSPGPGGAIQNNGPLTIVYSTFSGNTSSGGGAIANSEHLTIINSTITNNTAAVGGGIRNFPPAPLAGSFGVLTLWNTIVAGNVRNTSTGPVANDIEGRQAESASQHNLIGDANTSGGLIDAINGNIVGMDGAGTIDINTVLNTNLTNNGGATLTHLLASGSPAINTGNNRLIPEEVPFDQRGDGFPRIDGPIVDMGAVEATIRTIIVTNTNDSGVGSLRQAILDANANPGFDQIVFQIPISDANFVDVDSSMPGGDPAADAFVIQPLSALPALNDTTGGTTIDGHTQTAFGGDTNPFGPEIVVDGSMVPLVTNLDGFRLNSDRNNILGLNIQAFPGDGIQIDGNTNWVAGNYIGTDATGTLGRGNGRLSSGTRSGILIFGASNRVGTNADGIADDLERNVISANTGGGVFITGGDNNRLAGNFIGTDATGTIALGNLQSAVTINGGGTGNIVGTDGDGVGDEIEGNVISGNRVGVNIGATGTTSNVVAGNKIGTNVTGTAALGNLETGVRIRNGAQYNLIGTNGDGVSDAFEANLISGNGGEGILISATATYHNSVAGNLIGTDLTGTVALGNALEGVKIESGAQFNRIGTDGDGIGDAVEGNVISSNRSHGVSILDPGTEQNVVAGNRIGTDVTGSNALGNDLNGVNIDLGARSNIVGTNGDGIADYAERNTISGNGLDGISLAGDGTDTNVIAGNFIGTDNQGMAPLGNARHGVSISGGVANTIIGTNGDGVADGTEGNLISGNIQHGVFINHSNTEFNVVSGNLIGIDVTGTALLGNGFNGVSIANSNNNRIGTNGDGVSDLIEGNVIAGNSSGVLLSEGTSHTTIAGNFIGTDITGTVDLGNLVDGVRIQQGSHHNIIGVSGSEADRLAARNIISGNERFGIQIQNDGSNNNRIAGNLIGTDVTGTAFLGNSFHGINLTSGASENTIGTNSDGLADDVEGNVISGNGIYGVHLIFENTQSNVVAGNFIGTNSLGTSALGNGSDGILIEGGASGNTVGGSSVNSRNVVSGNGRFGIGIGGSDGNWVAGNYVGTDASGSDALGNLSVGIVLSRGASQNIVGTNGDGVSDAFEGNVVSANGGEGVSILNAGTEYNIVAGNLIGTDVTGSVAMGNGQEGVQIANGAQFNRVGTNGDEISDVLERNLISSNVNTFGEGEVLIFAAHSNVIAGNYIGTDLTGAAGLANGTNFTPQGVVIRQGSTFNRIGTNADGISDAIEANVISDNAGNGVGLANTGTEYNSVAGNFIGTDATGTIALGNGQDGVRIVEGARFNLVGTNADGFGDVAESNVISANGFSGVRITGVGADANIVAGNHIGTDVTGTVDLGNVFHGVNIVFGAQNIIGISGNETNSAAARNVISGNDVFGIQIQGEAIENVVAGNLIGTDITGTVALGNSSVGVNISGGSTGNIIGTNLDGLDDELERNVISGNLKGVVIGGLGTDANIISGNLIGTDITGNTSMDNDGEGVVIWLGAADNVVGGSNALARNVISGNAQDGVRIQGAGTIGTRVKNNLIGTDSAGTSALGNGGHGVVISGGASDNVIGTDGDGINDATEGNVIAFNFGGGVTITDASIGNTIRRNSIYSNGGLGIDLGGNGVTPNDADDTDVGPNGLQNSPDLSSVDVGTSTRVKGSLNSTANSQFVIEVFANQVPDPSGYGEGERFLGTFTVTTDSSGIATFDQTLAAVTMPGEFISATATDTIGNTSEFARALLPVEIDLSPGGDTTTINLAANGVIAIAILTTDSFDASTVNASTVIFAGAFSIQSALVDIDNDGDLDLILHFRINDTNLREIYAELIAADEEQSSRQEAEVSLSGETNDGELFAGTDTVDLLLTGKKLRDLLEELAMLGSL